MEVLNFIATIIGYIVMILAASLVMLMIFAALGRKHADINRQIYEAKARRKFFNDLNQWSSSINRDNLIYCIKKRFKKNINIFSIFFISVLT